MPDITAGTGSGGREYLRATGGYAHWIRFHTDFRVSKHPDAQSES